MTRITLLLTALLVAAGLIVATATGSAARKPATKSFRVAMTGEAETPAGDPVATGTATFKLRRGQARVCYTLAATTSRASA